MIVDLYQKAKNTRLRSDKIQSLAGMSRIDLEMIDRLRQKINREHNASKAYRF